MVAQRVSPPVLLGARPALPFILQTNTSGDQNENLTQFILDSLEQLQEISRRSHAELSSLRALNAEILEVVTRRLNNPGDEAPISESGPLPSKLELRLLGPFEARIGTQLVTSWPGRKARLLLAYLAMERGRMIPRDTLIELFWPGVREDRGPNNLSIAIYQIRSILAELLSDGSTAILVRQGMYGLDPDRTTVDLWDLRAALEAARRCLEKKDQGAVKNHLIRAVTLCRGELMASDPYEEWTAEPRRALNGAWQKSVAWLAEEAWSREDWLAALDFGNQMLQRDTCDESAYRLLMNTHLRMGNRSQALRQYQTCVETLRSELGIAPSPETKRVGEALSR